jgi:hypothetical protein
MTILDIEALRQHAIDALEKLSKKEITIEEAGVTGKLCENVVSTLKIQLEYSKMTEDEPNIPFLGDCQLKKGKLIEQIKEDKKMKLLEKK